MPYSGLYTLGFPHNFSAPLLHRMLRIQRRTDKKQYFCSFHFIFSLNVNALVGPNFAFYHLLFLDSVLLSSCAGVHCPVSMQCEEISFCSHIWHYVFFPIFGTMFLFPYLAICFCSHIWHFVFVPIIRTMFLQLLSLPFHSYRTAFLP